MALHQIGKVPEAKKVFASVMLDHEWRKNQVSESDGWTRHVLRREAERMILPQMKAILDGTQRPRDYDERIALIGVCRFENRFTTLAVSYVEAFAADPKLKPYRRFAAARAAAQAGCGCGIDAGKLSEAERANWRAQARRWLREELALMTGLLKGEVTKHRDTVYRTLTLWQNEPELAGIRDRAGLEKLPPGEKEDCRQLWAEVNALLDSTSIPK